jgi:hypothetical protein
MVLPGDDLKVNLRHVGMREGIVVQVETANDCGEKVLQGTAEIAQPTTVYVFTGQSSQEQGMSMDLYNSSLAARAVWDGVPTSLQPMAFPSLKFSRIIRSKKRSTLVAGYPATLYGYVIRRKGQGWYC